MINSDYCGLEFRSANIRVLIHATEDEKKVLEVICTALNIPLEEFVFVTMEGHYGNTVRIAKANLIGADVNALATKILESISRDDKVMMAREIETHLDDDGTFYIRLSKQELVRGTFRLSENDPVRIMIKSGGTYNDILDGYRKLFT